MRQVCITETSWIQEEGSDDEWNDDWSCVEWHEDCERMCCETVSSFAFESSERVNVCELGHKSYSRHIPSEL